MPAPSDINTLKHQYLVQETGLDADSALGELEHAFYTQGMDPDSFTGNALKIVRVNAGETGLEYVTATTVGTLVVMIPAASRTTYSSDVLGEGAWVTIANATLTGAGASHALVLINNTVTLADTVALGEEPYQYVYCRKKGSSEDPFTKNTYSNIDFFTIQSGEADYRAHGSFAIVECGTGGDAGKFDVYFDVDAVVGASHLATVDVIGYLV
jgi:hypothetical protein